MEQDNKKTIEIERFGQYLIMDGKYYKEEIKRGKRFLQEVDKKTIKKKIKLVDECIEKLKGSLDKEKVLREALMKFADEKDYLRDLHNALYNNKRKIKPKTRDNHCVDMKVGNMLVPIIN